MSRPQTPEEQADAQVAADARERADVAKLTDSEVLARAGHMGPGIIGQALYDRAAAVRKRTGDGKFGPALVDPDYGKSVAARAAEAAAKRAAAAKAREAAQAALDVAEELETDADETEGIAAPDPAGDGAAPQDDAQDDSDPWSQVTLSGAKMLAMEKQVSYPPKIKKAELIAQLIAAGIQPPPKQPPLPDDDPEQA